MAANGSQRQYRMTVSPWASLQRREPAERGRREERDVQRVGKRVDRQHLRAPALKRERCYVGPECASWPMHS